MQPTANQQKASPCRPVIFDYRVIPDYVTAMLAWRRHDDQRFSVLRETKQLHRCSPALVTKVMQGKRPLTLDRVPAFAKLLKLVPAEKAYLEQWVRSLAGDDEAASSDKSQSHIDKPVRKRREGQNHLLEDWLNVYVKDAARLEGFKADPKALHQLLGGIASVKHCERSLKFLLREGFLRRTPDGRIVENDVLVTAKENLPSRKISQFHKQTLQLAKNAIDIHPLERRWNGALILPMNRQHMPALKELLAEFYERLLQFAEAHTDDREDLYQVLINLIPVGGGQHADKELS